MFKPRIPAVAAAVALSFATSLASAATQLGEYVSVSGFGTIGAVKADDADAKYRRDLQPVGSSNNIRYTTDSNLGLQATVKPTSWVSGTVQLLEAQRDREQHSTLEAEWGFINLEPIDNLSIRGGRMAVPMFLVSDVRNVGYANTWLRPPDEAYSLAAGLKRMNGGDVSYRLPIGSTTLTMEALAGRSEVIGLLGTVLPANQLRAINLQLETEWATFRVGQLRTRIDLTAFNLNPDAFTFSGVGVLVDRNNVLFQAEYVTRRSEFSAGTVNSNGWYVMGGYRFSSVTPYAIYARTSPTVRPYVVENSYDQISEALGVRWDFYKSVALKVQYQHVDTNGTPGVSFQTGLIPPSAPGFPPGSASVTKPVNVVSVAVDFVF